MTEQQELDFGNANVLNIEIDYAKVTNQVKELALFAESRECHSAELVFALSELAGRVVVQCCGGHPLVAAKMKQALQHHMDNVVRVGFGATYGGGAVPNGDGSKIVLQ